MVSLRKIVYFVTTVHKMSGPDMRKYTDIKKCLYTCLRHALRRRENSTLPVPIT